MLHDRGGPMSGLAVRDLHDLTDLRDVAAMFNRIWRPPAGVDAVGLEWLRALSHAGNYVAGAYAGGRIVGASVGFLSAPAGLALHSHLTGADKGHGIGFALKLHQREWALARGLDRITWTFDPLVRRNAHFNVAKLGASPEEYLPSFYGAMTDAINGDDDSDRVLTTWRLAEPGVVAAAGRQPYRMEIPWDAAVGLGEADGRPVPGRTDAATVLVAVPRDIEGLRRADPGAARSWRLAMREVLGGLLAGGGRVTGFHRRSFYVVERDGPT
ncbi:GNAT family N-acetyltransferase [Nonomuraea sp. NPDC059023]|uniref:GNAT family N-acetyltransferase n=1 Tax=unclassified Nonomuraea TaxID=2593643 RepID=UPI0036B02CD5